MSGEWGKWNKSKTYNILKESILYKYFLKNKDVDGAREYREKVVFG